MVDCRQARLPDGSTLSPSILGSARADLPTLQADGEPLTSASRRPSGHGDSGAPHACVGDVIRVPVSVVSRLPQPVTVSGFQLAISILQASPALALDVHVQAPVAPASHPFPCRFCFRTAKHKQNLLRIEFSGQDPCPFTKYWPEWGGRRLQGMTVVISPRGENLLARGQPHQRTQSLRSLDSPGAPPVGLSGHRPQPGLSEVGTPGTAASTQDASQQHIGTRWQETDEVACSLAVGGASGEEPQSEELTLQPGANTLWCEVSIAQSPAASN